MIFILSLFVCHFSWFEMESVILQSTFNFFFCLCMFCRGNVAVHYCWVDASNAAPDVVFVIMCF